MPTSHSIVKQISLVSCRCEFLTCRPFSSRAQRRREDSYHNTPSYSPFSLTLGLWDWEFPHIINAQWPAAHFVAVSHSFVTRSWLRMGLNTRRALAVIVESWPSLGAFLVLSCLSLEGRLHDSPSWTRPRGMPAGEVGCVMIWLKGRDWSSREPHP